MIESTDARVLARADANVIHIDQVELPPAETPARNVASPPAPRKPRIIVYAWSSSHPNAWAAVTRPTAAAIKYVFFPPRRTLKMSRSVYFSVAEHSLRKVESTPPGKVYAPARDADAPAMINSSLDQPGAVSGIAGPGYVDRRRAAR